MEEVTLSYYEAITNEEVLEKESIQKYINEFQKMGGNLQSNTRKTITSKYQVFYEYVKWEGRGKNRTLKLGKKHSIPQISISKNTSPETVYGAALIVLYLHKHIQKGKKLKSPEMTRAKWLEAVGYLSNKFSFSNREDAQSILRFAVNRYIGKENEDILSFALRYYGNTKRIFIRDEFSKITRFLEKNYKLTTTSVDRFNMDEELIINLYADALCLEITKRQKDLVRKNIEEEMYKAWRKFYEGQTRPVPKNLKELILDYPIDQIKHNINRCISINNDGLGVKERVTFDIAAYLKIEDYEKFRVMKSPKAIRQNFYQNTSRITPTEDELSTIEMELNEYCVQNKFNKNELVYNNNSYLARGYKHTENMVLQDLGYSSKYSLIQFDYNSLEAFYVKPFLVTYNMSNKLVTVSLNLFTSETKGQYGILVMDTYVNKISQYVLESTTKRNQIHIKNSAYKNKAWIDIDKQNYLHESINDLLYVLLSIIDEFFQDEDNLPEGNITDSNILEERANKVKLFRISSSIQALEKVVNKEKIENYSNILECKKDFNENEVIQLINYRKQKSAATRAKDVLNKMLNKSNDLAII